MLISFEVANYRSFRDPARLSLEAVPAFKEREAENVIVAPRHRILKSVAIYGANASGKSNLVKALGFMSRLVQRSAQDSQRDLLLEVSPFKLDVATESLPSRFEIIFLDESEQVRYGFEADDKKVHSEWLFTTDLTQKRARECSLFLRESDGIDVKRGIADGRALVSRTRDDALFLSVAEQWNEPTARRVVEIFRKLRLMSGLREHANYNFSFEMLQSAASLAKLLEVCRWADTGIEGLTTEERRVEPVILDIFPPKLKEMIVAGEVAGIVDRRVTTAHSKYDQAQVIGSVAFDLERDESEGTKKLFRIAGPILDCLEHGYTVVIDELEANLHPLLTQALVRLFHTPSINTKNAQIVFCTHDTNLLSHGGLRRDQIWFVEKTRQGATELYSLADIKRHQPVRKDASVAKDYIQGRFGAIPYLGGLDAFERALQG